MILKVFIEVQKPIQYIYKLFFNFLFKIKALNQENQGKLTERRNQPNNLNNNNSLKNENSSNIVIDNNTNPNNTYQNQTPSNNIFNSTLKNFNNAATLNQLNIPLQGI